MIVSEEQRVIEHLVLADRWKDQSVFAVGVVDLGLVQVLYVLV